MKIKGAIYATAFASLVGISLYGTTLYKHVTVNGSSKQDGISVSNVQEGATVEATINNEVVPQEMYKLLEGFREDIKTMSERNSKDLLGILNNSEMEKAQLEAMVDKQMKDYSKIIEQQIYNYEERIRATWGPNEENSKKLFEEMENLRTQIEEQYHAKLEEVQNELEKKLNELNSRSKMIEQMNRDAQEKLNEMQNRTSNNVREENKPVVNNATQNAPQKPADAPTAPVIPPRIEYRPPVVQYVPPVQPQPLPPPQPIPDNTQYRNNFANIISRAATEVGDNVSNNYESAKQYLSGEFSGMNLDECMSSEQIFRKMLDKKDGSAKDGALIMAFQLHSGYNRGSYTPEYYRRQLQMLGYGGGTPSVPATPPPSRSERTNDSREKQPYYSPAWNEQYGNNNTDRRLNGGRFGNPRGEDDGHYPIIGPGIYGGRRK